MNMPNMTHQERQQKVKQLRESGMSYKEIGNIMGFGVERARQLYMKATRKNRTSNEVYLLYLSQGDEGVNIRMNVSSRTMGALLRIGVETIEQLKYLDDETILRTRQVGQKTYNEIKWFQRRVTK